MASIIKTTPFKAFLARSSTQSALNAKSPTPPSSPTSPKAPATADLFDIRYSKRASFDLDSPTGESAPTEELVQIETTSAHERKQSAALACKRSGSDANLKSASDRDG